MDRKQCVTMIRTLTLNRYIRCLWQRWYRLTALLLCMLTYLSGALMYLNEKNYATQFSYPLNLGSDVLRKLATQLQSRHGQADLKPINRFGYRFVSDANQTCRNELGTSAGPVKLLFVVKSALDHFEHRVAIRQTWGWTGRFSDVEIRRVFLLGVPALPNTDLQARIDAEMTENRDLVQAAFVDNYYNNTVKTTMGMHWAVTRCPEAQFIMLVDDDYYVSTKNVLRYLRRPGHYPLYLQRAFLGLESGDDPGKGEDSPLYLQRDVQGLLRGQFYGGKDDEDEEDTPDDDGSSEVQLYTGYVFASSKPHRLICSAWYISLAEYPYDRYPPYVTAGSVLLSGAALRSLYYASLYTVPFRFDDIYLAILAKKTDVRPLHNPNFFFWKQPYSRSAYTYLIASHGYDDPDELVHVWNEQRTLGNA